MPVNEDVPALVAAFEDADAAHRAVVALEQAGFPHDAVGFVLPTDAQVGGKPVSTYSSDTIIDAPAHDARDALQGAITGGM